MLHIRAYKLAATYKMTLMYLYFLVNIHINNQFTLNKVNGVVDIYTILFNVAPVRESRLILIRNSIIWLWSLNYLVSLKVLLLH